MQIVLFQRIYSWFTTITKVVNKMWNSKVHVKTIQEHMDSRKGAIVYFEM